VAKTELVNVLSTGKEEKEEVYRNTKLALNGSATAAAQLKLKERERERRLSPDPVRPGPSLRLSREVVILSAN
jgi:hypothetical protein